MLRVRFRPQARAEIREARGWYESRVAGLGRAFISELDTTISFLRLHPQMYAAVTNDEAVRCALLHRFPYSLVYEVVTAQEIVILACRHVRQDEMHWSLTQRNV
jgi:plasmid stabilization system protein ParE